MFDDFYEKVIKYTDKEYDTGKLIYCFPGREWVMSSEECDISCEYGYMWPFPFVSVINGDKGSTYICESESLRAVNIKKTKNSLILSFLFSERADDDCVKLFEHAGDHNSAIRCFQTWYKNNYGAIPSMTDDVRSCFHVRRLFFNEIFCDRSIIKDGRICLENIISEDITEIGGSDAVLLFDYGYNKETGVRCGNDRPDKIDMELLNEIKKQMTETRNTGVKAYYIYFDPYLIQKGSAWDIKYKNELEIKDKAGGAVRVWGPEQWHPCTGEHKWRKESDDYLKGASQLFDADGIYLDEVGNGTQYRCFRKDHKHAPGDQLKYEAEYVRDISRQFPGHKMMCEFAPVYDMAKYFNIVLSDTRSVLNIYRFIFPQIRFVRIINCDSPLGHSEWEINKSFFNGEGLWIDNNLGNEAWYPDSVKKLIKDRYSVLQRFSGCFSSDDVEMLCDTGSGDIFANRFTDGNSTVITLLNTDDGDREIRLEGSIFKNAEILLPVKSVKTDNGGMTICMGGHEVTAVHV